MCTLSFVYQRTPMKLLPQIQQFSRHSEKIQTRREHIALLFIADVKQFSWENLSTRA